MPSTRNGPIMGYRNRKGKFMLLDTGTLRYFMNQVMQEQGIYPVRTYTDKIPGGFDWERRVCWAFTEAFDKKYNRKIAKLVKEVEHRIQAAGHYRQPITIHADTSPFYIYVRAKANLF